MTLLYDGGVPDGAVIPDYWRRIHAASTDLLQAFPQIESTEGFTFRQWTRIFGAREWEARLTLISPGTMVGMLVNPELRCGIREHTAYFQTYLVTRNMTLSQDPAASDHTATLDLATRDGVTILHVQHEFSLFRDTGALSFLLSAARGRGMKTIMDYHTGDIGGGRAEFLRTWSSLANRVIVHSPLLADDLASFKPVEVPLALADGAMWAPEADALLADDAPIVASFGFHNTHKGFSELAQAMGLVRNHFPGAKLLIVGTHNYPWQDQIFRKVQALTSQGPSLLLDRYLPIQEAVRTLAIADLLVMPYRIDVRSQSGAVETALLSGRPVLASTSGIFSHIPGDHFIHRVPWDSSVTVLGESIREVLPSVMISPDVRRSRRRLIERRGSRIARIYDGIYKEITS